MVAIKKLTAETLLGAPRRSPAVPNSVGSHCLYTESTHDFQTQKTSKKLKLWDVEKTSSRSICDEDKVHDALWVPGTENEIIYLRDLEGGQTQVVGLDASNLSQRPYQIAKIDAPVSGLKLKALEDGGVAFVVVGLVASDGSLLNQEAAPKSASTGRIFDTAHVRIWTEKFKSERYSLWYNKLERQDNREWKLAGELLNAVSTNDIEAPSGMYGGGDPTNSFDISDRGIAFLAREFSSRKPEQISFSGPYYVGLNSFAHPPVEDAKRIKHESNTSLGACANIRISPDGQLIAYLFGAENDFQNTRLLTASVGSLTAYDIFSLMDHPFEEMNEYYPPDGFEFAGSNEELIISLPKHGRTALAHMRLDEHHKPRIFYHEGSVSGFYPLYNGNWYKLVVSSTSFIDNGLWQVVSVPQTESFDSRGTVISTIYSGSKHGVKFGLSPGMIREFWYEGADEHYVHTFMIRPNNFDETKKYPWVLMPHGGPISDWRDAWSTRWNMAAWAEQGYIILCPNVSGSTGYGVDWARRVEGEWGGNPFQDLLYLLNQLDQFPFLDQDKAVFAGASYGGYMVSWLFGHEAAERFCGAVWHSGIYSLPSFSVQSDVIVDNGEYGRRGPYPWLSPEELERWNPARPELLRNWKNAPPTLISHGEKDYRCPITEGIAALNTLQAMGVPSRFLTFDDEGHWVLNPENSLVWHNTVWDWVKRCVDGDIKRGDTTW